MARMAGRRAVRDPVPLISSCQDGEWAGATSFLLLWDDSHDSACPTLNHYGREHWRRELNDGAPGGGMGKYCPTIMLWLEYAQVAWVTCCTLKMGKLHVGCKTGA